MLDSIFISWADKLLYFFCVCDAEGKVPFLDWETFVHFCICFGSASSFHIKQILTPFMTFFLAFVHDFRQIFLSFGGQNEISLNIRHFHFRPQFVPQFLFHVCHPCSKSVRSWVGMAYFKHAIVYIKPVEVG